MKEQLPSRAKESPSFRPKDGCTTNAGSFIGPNALYLFRATRAFTAGLLYPTSSM